MRTLSRNRLIAVCAGLILLISACSSTGGVPEALAFEDTDSSGNPIEDAGGELVEETTTEAPTTTAEPTTTTSAAAVPRPNLTCSSADYSVAFPDNITLVSPVLTSAGPFAIALPAGTYEVTLQSWLGAIDFPRHTMEQWFFTTDSGYTSPLTTDHSPNLVGSDTITAVIPEGTTSVSLFHKPQDTDINNSVQPLCIGFNSIDVPETTTAAPATTAAPETTTAAPETTTVAPETTTAAPETTEAPETTTEAPAPTTTEATDSSDVGAGGDSGVAAGALDDDTTTTAAPTTTVARTSTDETVPAELALTGPGDLAVSLGLTGAALTFAGAAAIIASRRKDQE